MSEAARIDELAHRIRAAQLPPPPVRRAIRQGAGVSLREAARYLGVSAMTVLTWERGEHRPTREHAIRYRQLLDALTGVSR